MIERQSRVDLQYLKSVTNYFLVSFPQPSISLCFFDANPGDRNLAEAI